MDFLEGEILRASFEWQGGSTAINDEAALNRLEKLLRSADFTVGSVNCPSDAFLTIEFADGRIISPAVAINSFDLFFCNGMYFTTQENIIDLFNIKDTDLYKNMFGG